MHKIIHETIAAIGGSIFIIVGIARQQERRKLIHSGKKTEGPLFWNLLIIAGICLLFFAFGLMIYQFNRN